MGKGKKIDHSVSLVNAAIWRRGGWSSILVIVPIIDRVKAIIRVAELLHYRFQPSLKQGGGRLYLVSAETHVYLVQASSSDDARTKVKNLWGEETKRATQPLTLKSALYLHRSSPPPAPAHHWKCSWCGCRDLTLSQTEDQECPCCHHFSDNAERRSQRIPAETPNSIAEEKGWPPREADPTLFGINAHCDQYY